MCGVFLILTSLNKDLTFLKNLGSGQPMVRSQLCEEESAMRKKLVILAFALSAAAVSLFAPTKAYSLCQRYILCGEDIICCPRIGNCPVCP